MTGVFNRSLLAAVAERAARMSFAHELFGEALLTHHSGGPFALAPGRGGETEVQYPTVGRCSIDYNEPR